MWGFKHLFSTSKDKSAFALGLSEIHVHQKMQGCHKNVYDGLENAYYSVSDRNLCELWFVECTLFHLQSCND